MENLALIIYSLKGGGAERVVSVLSQELVKKYNLFIIIFDSDDIGYSYGGELIDLDVKSHNNILMKCINVIRRIYKVKKVKKQCCINTSISFLGSANIVNVLSKQNDKIIISIHSHVPKDRGFFNRISNFFNNKADKIVGVSKGVSNNLINNYELDSEKISYIYNPINLKEITELSNEYIPNDNIVNQEDFIIVNMGRLSNPKGQWHLIRAISDVKIVIPNIKLYILGQGELEMYLKNLAENLGLINNVIFLGYQKNPFKYIRKSDLFVFTSLYEGFGNVLIEAMACQTPIISTDCRSGPREILAPNTDVEYKANNIEYCEYGILVPVCDGVLYDYNAPLTREEKLLSKSIVDLYHDESLRKQYSDKGKERAKEFDISDTVRKWESLISHN